MNENSNGESTYSTASSVSTFTTSDEPLRAAVRLSSSNNANTVIPFLLETTLVSHIPALTISGIFTTNGGFSNGTAPKISNHADTLSKVGSPSYITFSPLEKYM